VAREGWYRNVSVRMWGDERFRQLSDGAKLLWVHLITGPHTTALPGISEAGRAQLAEAVRWPLKAFDRRFDEIAAQGMAKADWTARVLWLPKAVYHNPPDNPNIVRGWVKQLAVIPECSLKREAIERIRQFLEPFRESFLKAFAEPFGEPFPKQDQDQDQDLDQDQDREQKAFGSVGSHPQTHPNKKGQPYPGFVAFWSAYPNKKAKSAAEKAWTKLKPPDDLQRTILGAINAQRQSASWAKDGGQYVPHPATYLNQRRWEDSLDPPAETAAGGGAFVGASLPGSAKAYAGKRIQVWNWQHEEFAQALGSKSFDLLGWYPALDAEMERSGEPIAGDPKQWLRERFYVAAGLQRPNLMGALAGRG
jgi:hypothetical protein